MQIFRVWTSIRAKREAQLYRLSEQRRINVENVIFRFKFLMALTLGTAFCTVGSYWMQQHEEGLWLDPEEIDEESGGWTLPARLFTLSASAFLTGTLGMWNLYVLLLLALYAPSHKHYRNAQGKKMFIIYKLSKHVFAVLHDEDEDLMDPACGPSASGVVDSTPMTTFLKPAMD